LFATCGKLGNFNLEHLPEPKMTHLVYDGKNRTIKVLYALAKRAWILDKSFIFESLEFGDWVPEKDHENSQFPEKKLRDAW